ncbi:MAG: hypothetical protein H0U70_02585 [Tatlockia sp.]|nr:hypothetical protein [Tatlockia sp.]
MMNALLSNSVIKQFLNFVNFYHEYKVKSEKLISLRYRMITTLDEFKKSNLIQLAFSDNPGDLLAPISIEKIKKSPDIIEGMHPIDINTINDLYYLSRDKIIKVNVESGSITALKSNGQSISYNISDNIDPDSIDSTRLSYLIGYMQAEKVMREAYTIKDKYKIVKDNITTLEILDLDTNKNFLINPLDIMFSDDYKNFSKKDIGHIAYICGQMSRM